MTVPLPSYDDWFDGVAALEVTDPEGSMRTCTSCNQEKPESDFAKDKRRPDGLDSRCKACISKKTLRWFDDNPEGHAECRRRDRELIRQKAAVRRAQEEAAHNARMTHLRAWLDANQSLVAEIEAWWDDVSHPFRGMVKDRPDAASYAQEHGVCIRTAMQKVYPDVRAKFFTMKELRKALHGSRPGPRNNVWSRLKYTPAELKAHLTALFHDGMTWDNYGSYWCMDHLQPYASFGVQSIGDDAWVLAFDIKNLQPLTLGDNQRKHLTTWDTAKGAR